MRITEPMTMLTDYLLGLLSVWLGTRLIRRPPAAGRRSARRLGAALTASGLAALAGGTSHGFREVLGPGPDGVLWKLAVLAVGLSAFLLLAAVFEATLVSRWRRLALGAATVQWIVYSVWMLGHDEFYWVIADYVPAMLVVLVLEGLAWREGDAAAPWIVAGVLVSLVGAAIQASGLSLHRHFNHNDLYHVVQMGGAVLLHAGGRRLEDRRAGRCRAPRRPGW